MNVYWNADFPVMFSLIVHNFLIMKNILIYNDPTVAVTHFVDNLSVDKVHEQAQKMLKFGTLYRIGTTDEVPADRTFRDAWDIDDADLNDGIGGEVESSSKT